MKTMESARGWLYRKATLIEAGLTVLIATAPLVVFAQARPPISASQLPQPIRSTSDVQNLICGIIGWIFWGLIIMSVIMVLIAAYRYLTSAGNPEKVGTANKMLMYAAIGVAVALMAYGLPTLVADFLNGGGIALTACG